MDTCNYGLACNAGGFARACDRLFSRHLGFTKRGELGRLGEGGGVGGGVGVEEGFTNTRWNIQRSLAQNTPVLQANYGQNPALLNNGASARRELTVNISN